MDIFWNYTIWPVFQITFKGRVLPRSFEGSIDVGLPTSTQVYRLFCHVRWSAFLGLWPETPLLSGTLSVSGSAKQKLLQYRPNVSWQSFARQVLRLDPRFSILARIEDRGSSRASSLSRNEKVMSLSLNWFLEKLILLIRWHALQGIAVARAKENCCEKVLDITTSANLRPCSSSEKKLATR